MPTPRTTFLSAFAGALAERLPGTWTSEYHRHAAYEDQFPTVERLWDSGHVDHIVSRYVLGHDAVLTGPHGQQLYVTDRPLYRRQFVVAPLEPEGFPPHLISPVGEPNGIAVPDDPARAAAAVVRRLLPRYRHALAAVRDNARRQPSPVRRTEPHTVPETVMFTWHRDGTLATPYDSVPAEIRTLLYGHSFQYRPRDNILVLPAVLPGTDEGLSRIQAVARRLADHGFGMNVRPAPPARPTPTTAHEETDMPPPTTPTDPAGRYVHGRHVLGLTDRLNAAASYEEAAQLADQVLEPTDGLLERLAEFFEAAAEKAKKSEQDDGFDLSDDFQDAAATVRALGEDLHVAVDRMQALSVPRRQSWQEALVGNHATGHYSPGRPPPSAGPSSGRTR